jgi:hypothetical protein
VKNDQPEIEPSPPTQEARDAEAASIRRRWITIGEALAVIAVLISALTLWNSWSERSADQATKAAETQKAASRAERLVLTASADKRGLTLAPTSSDQTIQEQTITFPTALAAAPAKTTGEPRIETAWFAQPLKRAREQAGMPDDSRGDEKLPVLIETRFVVTGEPHLDVAIYDIGYTVKGKWIGGHDVDLRGLARVSAARKGGAQSQLDARWKQLFPNVKAR